MKAVILVGGEGTRLRPLTCNIPKSMVPIVNRPFLEHVIDFLEEHEINDIILTLNYLPDHIQSYFGDGSRLGVKLTYVMDSPPLGTAGAVRNAAQYLDDTFFVFNGDVFTNLDLTAMMEFHQEKKAKVSIALTGVDDPTLYGVVEFDARQKVQRFIEKPSWDAVTTNMINAGTYILEPEVLEFIPSQTHFMFEHGLFPLLLQKGEPIYAYPFSAYWIDMGTPEKYLKLHHDLLENAVTSNVVSAKEACNIHPTAQIGERVVIGKNCVIGPRVQVTGPAVLGGGCRIEEGAEIDGAILWQNAYIGAGAVLKNCIVANDCYVGKNCWVLDGCVLGDKVIVEDGNKLSPGTKVWTGKRVEPGAASS